MAYACVADIQARVAGRPLGEATKPSTAEVTAWLGEGEALILGSLAAVGCFIPAEGTNGASIIKSWICYYAEGLIRQSWSASLGQDDDGRMVLDRFYDLLDDISKRPSHYNAMLGGHSAVSTSRMRSHVIDNRDGKTIDAGDFDPIFTMDVTREF